MMMNKGDKRKSQERTIEERKEKRVDGCGMERREKDKGREMTLDTRATLQHKKMKTDRQTDTYTHRQAER